MEFEKLWKERGIPAAVNHDETNRFRFGNGNEEISQTIVDMPVGTVA